MKTIRRLATISLAVLLALAIGCERSGDSEEKAQQLQDLPSGQLVFEDDFDGEKLGDHWKSGYEGWEIVDGELHVQGARNDALWLQEKLPENFRVSFTARSESEEGDIKFEILGDGETHESGYVGIFGGWNNSLNIIARLDEHGDDRLVGADGHHVVAGRTYEMDVVRSDHRLRWYVDGQLFLSYDDDAPLRGEDHRYFAFNNWDSPLYFGDFRIYEL